MRKALLGLLVLALYLASGLVLAQSPSTSKTLRTTTCPGAGCVTLSVQGLGSVGVQVSGSFTGTLDFEATEDGVVYTPLAMAESAGSGTATSATAPGVWTWQAGALSIVRVRFEDYTEGSALVTLQGALGGISGPTGATGATGASGGGASLPLQVAADGDPVLLNAASDVVLSVSGGGFFQATDNTNGHILELGSAGLYTDAPMYVESSGIAASLTTDLGVPNADLTFTAQSVGHVYYGVIYEDPGLPDSPLSVSWDGTTILRYVLATDGAAVITSTAQDLIDIGGDGAPIDRYLAPGSDGSGIVTALDATLSGGLAVLNVTGPSSLDNGAITTSGSGILNTGEVRAARVTTAGQVQAGNYTTGTQAELAGGGTGVAPSLIAYSELDTDVSLDIAAQGAGTINLNSPVVVSDGAGVGNAFACFDSAGQLFRSATACVP